MANVAANLSAYNEIVAGINFDTLQLIKYNARYEGVHKKLEAMQRLETKYMDAYDKALDNDRELKACCNGRTIVVEEGNTSEQLAKMYAEAKVKDYDEDILYELAEEDTEYDQIKSMLETSIQEGQAQKESFKQLVQSSAQDNPMFGQ